MTISGFKLVGPPLTALVLLALTCPAADHLSKTPDSAADREQMERWWADLEKSEPYASRALLHLADRPKEVVPFFKARLMPLKISGTKLDSLLTQLASAKKEIWQAAFEELDYLDPRLAIELETLMNKVTDGPARQRLVELLSGWPTGSLTGKHITLRLVEGRGYNFSAEGCWWAEHKVSRLNTRHSNRKKKWTRAVRAIVLLKHIGTPDAIAILKCMATGHPDAQPTKVAREALDEVAGKVTK